MGDDDDNDDDLDAGCSCGGGGRDAVHRMAAGPQVYTLFRKRQFDYSFLLAAGQQTVTIQRALRLQPFYYHWVALRIHSLNIVGGTFRVLLYQTLPSRDDPQEFTSGSASLTLTCNASDVPPAIKTATSSDLGPFLKVALTATQGGVAGSRFYAEMSAVLYSRPA